MDFVKKNLISLICGVVAIIALVAVFVWPLDGLFEGLKEKATNHAAAVSKLTSLKNTSRIVPVIDIKDLRTQKANPLTRFPSKAIITLGELAQKQMRAQSERMYAAALQLNQRGHELAVKGTLPVPESAAVAFEFRKNLTKALDALRTDRLEAGIPPTPEQLKLREEALWDEMKKEIITLGDGSKPNEENVKAKFEVERLKLPDLMKKEMASQYKMYIDPSKVFVASPSLPEAAQPTPTAIWWSQVSYWVYNDVTATIKEVNANSTSVLDSPVKSLISLNVPEDFFPPISGAMMAPRGADAEAPTSATGGRPDPTIPLPESGAVTATRRASNNLYDVVQFKMSLDIESDKISLFLKTLATDRFITVTRVEMNPVDSQLQQIAGYVYGPRPVVTLNLDCEALFMREWTIPLMPQPIRDALGIPNASGKP